MATIRKNQRCVPSMWAQAGTRKMALPPWDAESATFHTDQSEAYRGVIPAERHKALTKHVRQTHHSERCNKTLRPRVARLVRETLSCSKKLAHHIEALKSFMCSYNRTRAPASA